MKSPEIALFSSLSLAGLRVPVKIGCSADERQHPQSIRFDIHFRFPAVPEGCLTDDLNDTLCYFKVSQTVEEICSRSHYCLIEKLGAEILKTLRQSLLKGVQMQIRITKEKPAYMPNLGEGASFTLGDWV